MNLRPLTAPCPRGALIGASILVAVLCFVRPAVAQEAATDLTGPVDAEAPATFVPASLGPLTFDPDLVKLGVSGGEFVAAWLGPLTFETDSVRLDVSGGDQDKAPEPTKRTRSFFDALYHNVVDDVKHLPRRNSVYFLAGGGALALAVHPIDHSLNAHLEGSGVAGDLFCAWPIRGGDRGANERRVCDLRGGPLAQPPAR